MPYSTISFFWPTVSKWNAETFFVLWMRIRFRKHHHSKLPQYSKKCVPCYVCCVWVTKLSAITCSKWTQSQTYSMLHFLYTYIGSASKINLATGHPSVPWDGQTYSSQTSTLSASASSDSWSLGMWHLKRGSCWWLVHGCCGAIIFVVTKSIESFFWIFLTLML